MRRRDYQTRTSKYAVFAEWADSKDFSGEDAMRIWDIATLMLPERAA